MEAVEARFRVMGCEARVLVAGGDASAVQYARDRLVGLERIWSRFVPTSDVSRVVKAPSKDVVVQPETIHLLQRSMEAMDRTGGRFDPFILDAVIEAGYTNSMNDGSTSVLPTSGSGCVGPEIGNQTIRLGSGRGFDPGGIGKGLVADLVVSELTALGVDAALVSIGGDLRAGGMWPEEWPVVIDDPRRTGAIAGQLTVINEGVATTTPVHRRWRLDGAEPGRHIIDPVTREPVHNSVASVTVVAPSAWEAEAFAKSVAVLGADEGRRVVDGVGLQVHIIEEGVFA